MRILTLLILCSFSIQACSQRLSEADLRSRKVADSLLESQLQKEIEGKSHVIFSVADKEMIVVVKNTDSFKEFYLNKDTGIIKDTTLMASDPVIIKMFDKSIYREGFTTFNSGFFESGYEISSGSITYFVFKDEQGKRYGEARLSVFIKPNPVDTEVYAYFVEKLIFYSKTT
ncbi:hypothetical protein GCM10007049_35920 [Echinicola pacifica]|uniref:Lipoprotein n=1 Tax=Echinicola pacifica TaxID=346377 RepID=A0A918UWF8_9BACT|nr:hypothetical protein [Echinicola pacifica]GGZ39348.1 hypothetical protein GCM10007049_35920 [Echinicola pacifica]